MSRYRMHHDSVPDLAVLRRTLVGRERLMPHRISTNAGVGPHPHRHLRGVDGPGRRSISRLPGSSTGRRLGDERPALYVADMIAIGAASVHHRRYREPEWAEHPQMSGGRHLSWRSKPMVLTGQNSETGERDDRPLMLVNPSLEQVSLS